ncbi:hypothetical protein [Streptomyces sp. NPDC057877]|uniref:hypothetical protein n=1 Tax=Streptomyces sp. NPDC057877 TaxID=3346269 RepID=UPI0036C20FFB
MNETEEVRGLLARAVDGVPVPTGLGTDGVFERAARLRWRRRAAVTGTVAAVAAVGLVLGTGALSGGGQGGVAASPTGGVRSTGADGFTELLPKGIGDVKEVSLLRLVKREPQAEPPKDVGPYDGDYAVERDGGVGYLTVGVVSARQAELKRAASDPCARSSEHPYRKNCTTERLPDGTRLSLWEDSGNLDDPGTHPNWGPSLEASLRMPDGSALRLRDITGYLGTGSPGPLLADYPLSRPQLRELALRPELRPQEGA